MTVSRYDDKTAEICEPRATKAAICAILAVSWYTLTGCAGTTVVATPNSCAVLIPSEWSRGVPAPDLPADDTVGSWVSFGDNAVGKLDQANGRQRDTLSIITACEARDAKAVRSSTKSWLARIFD